MPLDILGCTRATMEILKSNNFSISKFLKFSFGKILKNLFDLTNLKKFGKTQKIILDRDK